MKQALSMMVLSVAIAGSALIASSATAASNPVKVSQKCRGTIAAQASSLTKLALKIIDGCHSQRDKGKFSGDCNTIAVADTKGKYQAAVAKATVKIDKVCAPGDQVRDNYPPTGDVEGAVFPSLLGAVQGSAAALQGTPALGGDKAKIKCHTAIDKAESGVINEIVKGATKCQKAADKLATSFHELQADCVATPVKSGPKGTAAITKSCGALTGADVGSCVPLPQCLVGAATTTGQTIATAIYGKPEACGNSDVEGVEECDDGNQSNTDGCTNTCHLAVCGDGFIHEGVEECDQTSNGCVNCQIVFTCGNGVTEVPGEECDDANSDDQDACTNACKSAICGDSIVRTGSEECDDGNSDNTDACAQCKTAVCGDGFIQQGTEQCDDGNQIDGDGCTGCVLDQPVCGNSHIEAGETCDDGNTSDGDDCPSTCVIAACTPGATTRNLTVSFAGAADVAAIVVYIEYPEGKVSIPGVHGEGDVLDRISGSPSGALVQPNDINYAIGVGVLKTSPIPVGQLFVLQLDDCTGAEAPVSGEFPCTVTDASDRNGSTITGVTCTASLAP